MRNGNKIKIDLNRVSLMLVMTLGCTASCGHCVYYCCPEKAHYRITRRAMVDILHDAKGRGINSVCITGGEPFIFPDDLLAVAQEAYKLGMDVGVRSNGFWAADDDVAEKVLVLLLASGVSDLGLSYDRYHARFVPLARIKRILRIAQRVGLDVWLDWCGNDSHRYVYGRLGRAVTSVISIGPADKVGRATTLPAEDFRWASLEELEFETCYSYRCGFPERLRLDVFPEGYAMLHNCCGANPRLLKRRPANGDWIGELVKETESDPAVNYLYRHGVGGLIRRARQDSILDPSKEYADPCQLCYQLLGRFFPYQDGDIKNIFAESSSASAKNEVMEKQLCQRVKELADEHVTSMPDRYIITTPDGYRFVPVERRGV